MNASIFLLLLLALLAANLPFVNERIVAFVPFSKPVKPFWLRFLELIFLYGLLGLAGYFLESRLGNAQSQGWEFYAITFGVFLVMAYPGFVWRYLRRHH